MRTFRKYLKISFWIFVLGIMPSCENSDENEFRKLEDSNDISKYVDFVEKYPESKLSPEVKHRIQQLKIDYADSSFQLILGHNYIDADSILSVLIDLGIADPVIFNNYASLLALTDPSDLNLTRVLQLYQLAKDMDPEYIVPDITGSILVFPDKKYDVPFAANIYLHSQSKIKNKIKINYFLEYSEIMVLVGGVLVTNISCSWGKHDWYKGKYFLRQEIDNNILKMQLLSEYNDGPRQRFSGIAFKCWE